MRQEATGREIRFLCTTPFPRAIPTTAPLERRRYNVVYEHLDLQHSEHLVLEGVYEEIRGFSGNATDDRSQDAASATRARLKASLL